MEMLMNNNKKRCRHTHGVPLLFALSCLVVIGGCSNPEKLGRVFGKVTFQGQPVSEGMIQFSNSEKGVYLTAPLKKDGTYEVSMAQGFGLPLGTYEVAVAPPMVTPPMSETANPSPVKLYPNIPFKYRIPATNDLTLTVEDGENRFDVNMTP